MSLLSSDKSQWNVLKHILSRMPDTSANQDTFQSRSSPAGTIPKFFFKKQDSSSAIRLELTRLSLLTLQDKHGKSILSNDELDKLWICLCSHATIQSNDKSQRVSFAQFQAVEEDLDTKYAQFFKPSLFLRFSRDDQGRIDILAFFNFVLRKVSLMQARADLSIYDEDADGYLTEFELQTYIKTIMPTLNLRNISAPFEKFYICTAVRKILFFLDPLRRGKVAIECILLSPILTELLELRDPDLPREYEQTNWFSSYSALRVYGQFLNLDTDRNGMVSRKELSKYRSQTLTGMFLDRVFQENQTYNNEMDFNAYLDFVLAMENMRSPQSITYCFKLLDIYSRGYLDENIISTFFQEVSKKQELLGYELVPAKDIVNELFDMAHPKDLTRITLQDLIECGMGGTFISILCDCNGLQTYESRDEAK
ncbi:hypothetical protein RTP6_005045 [Batrachochytrium dendrobatidis]